MNTQKTNSHKAQSASFSMYHDLMFVVASGVVISSALWCFVATCTEILQKTVNCKPEDVSTYERNGTGTYSVCYNSITRRLLYL